MRGHKQRLPGWALEVLHKTVRKSLDDDLTDWRKTLQKDPYS